MGLGKARTRFGEWIDRKGITQGEIVNWCKLNKETVSQLCNDNGRNPNRSTKARVVSGLNSKGYNVMERDLWEL